MNSVCIQREREREMDINACHGVGEYRGERRKSDVTTTWYFVCKTFRALFEGFAIQLPRRVDEQCVRVFLWLVFRSIGFFDFANGGAYLSRRRPLSR